MTDAGRLRAVALRIGEHHHPHLICRNCGTVANVDCEAGHAPCLEPAAAAGFEVHEAELTFWGLCPVCQPGRGREGAEHASRDGALG